MGWLFEPTREIEVLKIISDCYKTRLVKNEEKKYFEIKNIKREDTLKTSEK